MSETVRLQRDYPASPDRVFAAWSRVDLLRRWFGCGLQHAVDRARLGRPGRRRPFHVSLTFDHGPFEARGEFLVVDPPHRLRYSFGDQIVDVTIEGHGSGCRLTVEHTRLLTQDMCGIVTAGWTSGLAQLAGLVGSEAT